MGKKIERDATRKKREILEERVRLIRAALNKEATTRSEICRMTGLTEPTLSKVFSEVPDLYAEFKVLRSIIVDNAADNIARIIQNKNHRDHFAASKYVLTHYKSDLDDSLEEKESGGGLSVKVGGKPTASPVKIMFKSKKKK